MKFQIALIRTLLCVIPIGLNAQGRPLDYVWNRKGVAIYPTPFAHSALDTLRYGMSVKIVKILPDEVDKPLFTYQSDTVAKGYVHSSRWILIEFGNQQRGYITDTYLLEYPPNRSLSMTDYLSQLAAIVEERNEGTTDQFCSRSSYTYENGIRYSYTDLGPCEACGHGVTEIFLPGWTIDQAFVFITNFDSELWSMDGAPIENYQEHMGIIEGKRAFSGTVSMGIYL